MQLLSSWRESLSLFKPANFKLFVLVTLKSLLTTYKVWLKYWGWLAAITVGIILIQGQIIPSAISTLVSGFCDWESPHLTIPVARSYGFALIFCTISTLFLATRPSIDIKDYPYFMKYVWYDIYIFIWFIALSVLSAALHSLSAMIPLEIGGGLLWLLIESAILSFLTGWFILFLCDTHGYPFDAIKSVWRATKMVLFNVPFCLLMFLILVCLSICIAVPFELVLRVLGGSSDAPNIIIFRNIVDIFIILPLIINITTNFYVKRIHEQYQLYFG